MASSRSLWTKFLSSGPRVGSTVGHPPAARISGFRGEILGVDPSVRGTGLAVMTFGSGAPVLIFSSTIRVPARVVFTEALGYIHQGVADVLVRYPRIQAAAVEETIFVQNLRTAQLMGAARGAALGVIAGKNIPICQLAPKAIKLAATGNGSADKHQVQKMTQALLSLAAPLPPDEADAAAAAFAAVARNLVQCLG